MVTIKTCVVTIKTSFLHIQPTAQEGGGHIPTDGTSSGINLDHLSSDDSSTEDANSSGSGEEATSDAEKPIESLMSMENLQLPKTIELESQTLRPVETQSLRACTHGMRIVICTFSLQSQLLPLCVPL